MFFKDILEMSTQSESYKSFAKFISEKRFLSNQDAINAVDGYFESLDTDHFKHGIELLEKRWTKCVELGGY